MNGCCKFYNIILIHYLGGGGERGGGGGGGGAAAVSALLLFPVVCKSSANGVTGLSRGRIVVGGPRKKYGLPKKSGDDGIMLMFGYLCVYPSRSAM